MAKQFLTLDEITAEAMSIVPGATSEEQLYARQWAYSALRELGPSDANIEVSVLYPENFKMMKPEAFHMAIDLGLFDSTGREILHTYKRGKSRVHQPQNEYLNNGIYAPEIGSFIEVSEDAYSFNLSSNSENVAYAKLRYFKFPVDENNNPMFPEHTRHAVMMYVRYLWALRMGDQQFKSYEDSWKVARAEARGMNKRINGLLYKKLAREWMSMIPNFNNMNSF